MAIDIEALTAFLGGSIATLISKEVLNQFNKRLEFKRDIEKITYQRKLEKAEKAIAFYYTYLHKSIMGKKNLEAIKYIMENISESEQDIEILSSELDKIGTILHDLAGDKYYDVNSIHLYFDLDDASEWNDHDIGASYQCIAEVTFHSNGIQKLLELHETALKENNGSFAEACLEKMRNENFPKYLNALQNLINIFERNTYAVLSIIGKIKTQVKK